MFKKKTQIKKKPTQKKRKKKTQNRKKTKKKKKKKKKEKKKKKKKKKGGGAGQPGWAPEVGELWVGDQKHCYFRSKGPARQTVNYHPLRDEFRIANPRSQTPRRKVGTGKMTGSEFPRTGEFAVGVFGGRILGRFGKGGGGSGGDEVEG